MSRNFAKDLNRENNFRKLKNSKWMNCIIAIAIVIFCLLTNQLLKDKQQFVSPMLTNAYRSKLVKTCPFFFFFWNMMTIAKNPVTDLSVIIRRIRMNWCKTQIKAFNNSYRKLKCLLPHRRPFCLTHVFANESTFSRCDIYYGSKLKKSTCQFDGGYCLWNKTRAWHKLQVTEEGPTLHG